MEKLCNELGMQAATSEDDNNEQSDIEFETLSKGMRKKEQKRFAESSDDKEEVNKACCS